MFTSVIQEEVSGCGIASVANILGKSYVEMKAIANGMGIEAEDERLWSDTRYVRRMLSRFGVETSDNELPFESWDSLPDCALLAIKHHREGGRDFWHWVVFRRQDGRVAVLDSAAYLPKNVRTDFESMQPTWFIAVRPIQGRS
ncbi:MAG: hypothetical protein Q7Q73_17970 [Verrucomicrobiota bacterium JB024]|nr:hypothetical protein [Verrucomicrobiota bacterium JB024]